MADEKKLLQLVWLGNDIVPLDGVVSVARVVKEKAVYGWEGWGWWKKRVSRESKVVRKLVVEYDGGSHYDSVTARFKTDKELDDAYAELYKALVERGQIGNVKGGLR